jgi:acetyl-CoA carboxylase biotin carboxyl carrier protein
MSLSNEDVLQILALLDASGFDELRVETSDYKLHLRRSIPANEPPAAADAPPAPATVESAVAASPAASGEAVVASVPASEHHAVTVGATVNDDTVIGIVEVMKLMNSICAGASGTIVEIVARDGDLVEFGDVIVRIAPSIA